MMAAVYFTTVPCEPNTVHWERKAETSELFCTFL